MSSFEPDTMHDGTPAEEDFALESEANPEADVVCEPKRSRLQRVLKWVAITFFSVIGFVVVAGFMLYNFGGMGGTEYPELLVQYDQAVAAGQAEPLQKRFVIPIPGCTCHSTDPTLTALHSKRRLKECSKCHNTDPAHMEPGLR